MKTITLEDSSENEHLKELTTYVSGIGEKTSEICNACVDDFLNLYDSFINSKKKIIFKDISND